MDGMSPADNIGAKAALTVSADQIVRLLAGLDAARYAFHRVVAHKYAVAALNHDITLDDAYRAYEVAMKNFDGIVQSAKSGANQEANQAHLAKGAKHILELVDTAGKAVIDG